MPTFTELVTTVTTAVSSYEVLMVGGAIVGLIYWGLRKFAKAGR